MKLLCLLLSITYASCFPTTDDPLPKQRILASKVKKISKTSHQAAFEYDGKFKSSATIISPTWLISVAHIFANCTDVEKRGAIRTGTPFKETGGNIFKIKKVVLHPEFDVDKLANNLALIELEAPIAFGRTQKPLHVAEPYEDDVTGIKMRIARLRWPGQSSCTALADATDEPPSSSLLYVRVTSDEVCDEAYEDARMDGGKLFCTERLTEAGAAWAGDYGAGVAFYSYLFGVTSRVDVGRRGLRRRDSPTIDAHVKVWEHYAWISRTARLAMEI